MGRWSVLGQSRGGWCWRGGGPRWQGGRGRAAPLAWIQICVTMGKVPLWGWVVVGSSVPERCKAKLWLLSPSISFAKRFHLIGATTPPATPRNSGFAPSGSEAGGSSSEERPPRSLRRSSSLGVWGGVKGSSEYEDWLFDQPLLEDWWR